jgi:hypothetical protein
MPIPQRPTPAEQPEAKIVVSEVIQRVTHLCGCDSSKPSFDGVVTGISIKWPVAFGRFSMTYCPWCGLRLPDTIKAGEPKHGD